MVHSATDILIIGGGIIGLLTAKFLSEEGHKVTLLERKQPAQESSWAGGGILSPLYPWRYPDSVNQLAQWGHQYYPTLANSLRQQTHIDPEYYQTGLLIAAPDEIDQAQTWAEKFGHSIGILDESETLCCEPRLKKPDPATIWLPDVANIRNPRLGQSLIKSVALSGVNIIPDTEVTQIVQSQGRITEVRTTNHTYSASQYLVAAGAWSSTLLKNILPDFPVYPMKGQMILFKTKPGEIKRMLLKEDRYIIPRKDGHTLFGSTLERVGFDKATSPTTKTELASIAQDWFPVLKTAPIVKHWAGLRPASPEGIPTIAQHPEIKNLFINAGHFRNGVILGAASAQLMSNLILSQTPIIDPTPYEIAPTL